MPFYLAIILLQVAFVVHIVKTGRDTLWIWIVIMLPLAGSIAYFIIEILPNLLNSRSGRNASRKLSQVINPNRDLHQAVTNLQVSNTVENSIKLAEELMNKGMFAEARQLYAECLKGIYETDPIIMAGLARAEFGLGHYETCRDILDKLIEYNPEYKNADDHLMYARAQELSGNIAIALHEYETLAKYFTGPEAKYHLAMLYKKTAGKEHLAKAILTEIVSYAKTANKHYKQLYAEWIEKAKQELNNGSKN